MNLLRIDRSRTIVEASPAELCAASQQLRQCAYVKLSGLFDGPLLAALLDTIDRTEFHRRVHEGIGVELCAASGAASGALEFLLNDPVLFDAISAMTGCGTIGCFEGRVYRIVPSEEHYDSWHSDVGQDRLLALSINLGRRPFDGGRLQIRRADSATIIGEVENATPGDAVLFRVDPALRHRVSPVAGDEPRTAYAGWFRAAPDFRQLLAVKLRHGHAV
jgi:hypothetical protein